MGSASAPPPVGLCETCRHQQVVRNTRGGRFSLCRRSRDEPERYPRYPRIPVRHCEGYEARPATEPGSPTEAEPGPPAEAEPGPPAEAEAGSPTEAEAD